MSHTKYISDVLDDQTKTSNGTMLYHINSIELYQHLYDHFPWRDGALVVYTQDLHTNISDTYYQPMLPISKNMTIETNICMCTTVCTIAMTWNILLQYLIEGDIANNN